MPKQRLTYIDSFKGFCMFLVILSHAKATYEWYLLYNPIFISGFFFVSGLFFYNSNHMVNARQKLLNITTSLVLPYILYWIISYGVDHIIKGDFFFFNSLLKDILMGKKLWFISVLVVSELLLWCYMWCWKGKYEQLRIYLLPLISLTIYIFLPKIEYPWYFRTAFFACFYLSLGMVVRLHQPFFKSLLNSFSFGIVVGGMLIIMTIADLLFIHQKGGFHHVYFNYPFFIIESVIAIWGYLCLFLKVFNKFTPFIFIGKNSLLYYFFQHQVLLLLFWITQKVHISTDNWWYCLGCAIITSLLLWPVILLVNRFFPVLTGKYRIHKKNPQ